LTLISYLAYSLFLKMEAVCSSKTWSDFQQTPSIISQKIEIFLSYMN
jgi:hypothetical protein